MAGKEGALGRPKRGLGSRGAPVGSRAGPEQAGQCHPGASGGLGLVLRSRQHMELLGHMLPCPHAPSRWALSSSPRTPARGSP